MEFALRGTQCGTCRHAGNYMVTSKAKVSSMK